MTAVGTSKGGGSPLSLLLAGILLSAGSFGSVNGALAMSSAATATPTRAPNSVPLIGTQTFALGASSSLAVWASLGVRAPATPAITPQETAANQTPARPRRPQTRDSVSTKLADATVEVGFGLPTSTSKEFEELETLTDGEVARFFSAPAIRMRTEIPLLFGTTKVETGNVAPDYPGVYSLWLRKAASGWELAFNDQGDVWGSQYDENFDRVVVPLLYRSVEESAPVFDIAFESEDPGEAATSGQARDLVITWGQHQWRATFSAAPDQ